MKAIKSMKKAKQAAATAAPAPKAMKAMKAQKTKAACCVFFRNRSERVKGVRMIPGGVTENTRVSEM